MVELVYKFDESLSPVFEKVSRPLKYIQTFWGSHTYTYIYISNRDIILESAVALYVGLSGIVRNLIQKSTGCGHTLLSIFFSPSVSAKKKQCNNV